MGEIYKAISGVMADIGAVGKNDVNKSQGFNYRGIDTVMNALNPVMVKHKVFCVPEVLEQSREERTTKGGSLLIYSICKIRFKFYTTDGSCVEAVTIGEGMDSGDKATNKAMSVAFKYACFQVFCIPTEEMADPDSESHEPEPKQDEKPKKTPENKSAKDKITEEKVTGKMIAAIEKELERTGVDPGVILELYHVNTFNELTVTQYNSVMYRFKKTADKGAS